VPVKVYSQNGVGLRIMLNEEHLRIEFIQRIARLVQHHTHQSERILQHPTYSSLLSGVAPISSTLPLSDEDLIVWFFFYLGFWLAEGCVDYRVDSQRSLQRLQTTQSVDRQLQQTFQSIFGGQINGVNYRIQTLACLYILLPIMMPLVLPFPYNHSKLVELWEHLTRP